ncbi:P-loop containing nucleoside triphosphate hydrolase protein [Mycena floridula]|nr:P-loop containing nucleoside triphosphate hydrolase protein [Mycena floridula]
MKRKISDDGDSDFGFEEVSEDEIDISSSLAFKKPRANEQSDDDLDFIQDSIAKRNVKGGTEALKKVKGKAKMVKGEVGGGSFQSMGLHPSLLRSLTLQGYRIPTPIQRLAIPALLSNPPRDLVGMARTGSGKSLAYMVPLVNRLGGRHSTTYGARALILLPTRELSLQILKVGKELSRGWHGGEGDHAGDSKAVEGPSKGQSLRWGLIVGGEGMDEQFEMISNNPDIIIATPGRLLHLIVEMNLDLKSVQYVVFDEADRLFEMGFETALNEILMRLPASRQTLLFSATLPKSLVEFAKAGLQEPKLVRLDTESKISPDLKMAFFSVNQVEKEACLLYLLREVIKVPFGADKRMEEKSDPKKGKGKGKASRHEDTAPHQTIVFASTKHHVEYLMNLLTTAGYAVSHIYGSLDQAARTYQMEQFRRGHTNILVVTDVAARGIDIPVLENVINYDFPQGARVFVHRVGRTARAGRQGWAWSFVTNTELPYLLDLQLFLGRPLKNEVEGQGDQPYIESLVLGTFGRESIDNEVEYIRSLDDANHSLPSLRQVMIRGHGMYERSKGKASPPSYKRAKEMVKDPKWSLAGSSTCLHPILHRGSANYSKEVDEEAAKQALLRAVNSFKPAETVFEVGGKGKNSTENAALMKERRKALDKSVQRSQALAVSIAAAPVDLPEDELPEGKEVEMANEEDIVAVFETSGKKQGYRDPEFYMTYHQKDADTEKGYSLADGATFVEQARNATFDITGDEGLAKRQRSSQLTWDKKKKKFVKGDGVGADNVKMVRTENGTKLPASYRSGRFDEWKSKARVSVPRVGDAENTTTSLRRPTGPGGQRFRHQKIVAAKPLDKRSTDYERKTRQLKKKAEGAEAEPSTSRPPPSGKRFGGRNAGKPFSRVKAELKTVDQVRKSRKDLDNRRAKTGRHQKGKGKGRR